MASWRQWSGISDENDMDRHSLRSGWHIFWIYVPIAQEMPLIHIQALDGSIAVRLSLKRCTVSWRNMMICRRYAHIRLRFFFTADAWIGRNYFAAVSRHTASYFENQWKSEADKWHQPIDRAVNFADILYLSFDQSIDRPCNLKPIWGVTYLYRTKHRCNRMIFINLIIMYPDGVLRRFTLTL